jgi:Protein of unknown function (DUF2490)
MAQTPPQRIRDVNANSWWVYAGDHPIGKGPWGVYSEVQIRRSNFASTWQQLQFRDALTYRFSPNVQVAAGYVWTRTARYGDFPTTRPLLDHRTYEQLIVKHSPATLRTGALDLEHRYRVEQRLIETIASGGNYLRYQNRFRYQMKAVLPITKADAHGRQWSLFAGDEILIHFGPNHGPSPLDQNRAFAGVGYKFTKNNKLEVGYLNQFILQRNGRIEESNHTMRVQWSSSTPVFRR